MKDLSRGTLAIGVCHSLQTGADGVADQPACFPCLDWIMTSILECTKTPSEVVLNDNAMIIQLSNLTDT